MNNKDIIFRFLDVIHNKQNVAIIEEHIDKTSSATQLMCAVEPILKK
jgi:hypothetical protein